MLAKFILDNKQWDYKNISPVETIWRVNEFIHKVWLQLINSVDFCIQKIRHAHLLKLFSTIIVSLLITGKKKKTQESEKNKQTFQMSSKYRYPRSIREILWKFNITIFYISLNRQLMITQVKCWSNTLNSSISFQPLEHKPHHVDTVCRRCVVQGVHSSLDLWQKKSLFLNLDLCHIRSIIQVSRIPGNRH